MLGVSAPVGGEDYVFEKCTLALGLRRGFADVFKRGHFAWEYKAPGRPLDAALRQLMMSALALHNPPLLIVSDRRHIEIHTHFNGTPSERHVIELEELGDPAKRELLRRCFTAPDRFKPARTNRQITEEAANAFATTAERLREVGITPEATSHLLTPPPTVGPTTRPRCPMKKFCAACWRSIASERRGREPSDRTAKLRPVSGGLP